MPQSSPKAVRKRELTKVFSLSIVSWLDHRSTLKAAIKREENHTCLNYPEQDLRVHQAQQLKGSILYYGGRKADGLALLRQAWEWNLANPGNSYEGTFCGVAGEILKIEGQI